MPRCPGRAGGSVHEDGIGSSSSGSITGAGGACVDIPGGTVGAQLNIWSCNGGNNQNWVRAADGTLRARFTCMTASGTDVRTAACDGPAAQQSRSSGTALVNPATGQCLDACGGGGANGPRSSSTPAVAAPTNAGPSPPDSANSRRRGRGDPVNSCAVGPRRENSASILGRVRPSAPPPRPRENPWRSRPVEASSVPRSPPWQQVRC
ncbi:ricin-type beta-trefoil lectin domain protein [Streptomyces sp. NPDC056178]|uniref:ricin-type beta-trefoil lectin domain protein n=1 Tax=unclassified Streptomyces TaxID=2593676 RepID=UPI0035DFF1C8